VNLTPNRVRNRMTLGQSEPAPTSVLSPDVTSSPLFVAGVTILGVAFLMSLVNTGSAISRTVRRHSTRSARRQKRIQAAREALREAERR
jgi:hypothetical protein